MSRTFANMLRTATSREGGLLGLMRKALLILRTEGLSGVGYRVRFLGRKRFTPEPPAPYLYRPLTNQSEVLGSASSSPDSMISVLLCGDSDPHLIALSLASLQSQWYESWELCVADDFFQSVPSPLHSRTQVLNGKQPETEADLLNSLVEVARGDLLMVLPVGVELTVDALYLFAQAAHDGTNSLLYSDDDLQVDGRYEQPRFKPGFLPDLIYAADYTGEVKVYRRLLLEQLSGWRRAAGPGLHLDLLLRAWEAGAGIGHIPMVAWHRPQNLPKVAAADLAPVLRAHLDRIEPGSRVSLSGSHHLTVANMPVSPEIAVIIPGIRDAATVRRCLSAAQRHTRLKARWYLICEAEDVASYQDISAGFAGVELVAIERLATGGDVNHVIGHCTGDYLAYLDPAVEICSDAWLERLVAHAARKSRGVIGGKLLDRQDRVCDLGAIVSGQEAVRIQHIHQGLWADASGDLNRATVTANLALVSARLFMVRRDLWLASGGLGNGLLENPMFSHRLALQARAQGYWNTCEPEVMGRDHAFRYQNSLEQTNTQRGEWYELSLALPRFFIEQDNHFSSNQLFFDGRCHPVPKYTTRYLDHEVGDFDAGIVSVKQCRNMVRREVCLFAHYARDGRIAAHVCHLVAALSEHVDIVFISATEDLAESDIARIQEHVAYVIVRKNLGYDFGSWKAGMQFLKEQNADFDHLLLCNDSVFGPLYPLSHLVKFCRENDADVIGVTESFEGPRHLQSYFLWMKSSVVTSEAFGRFWQGVGIIANKQTLVREYEVGLSQVLIEAGFSLDCYASADRMRYLNPAHAAWRHLLEDLRCPFIKVELLRDNPMGVDISGVRRAITELTDYPYPLIAESLREGGQRK